MTDYAAPTTAADSTPPSRYELVTRTRLDDLGQQVDRLEAKLNALLVAAVASLIAALVHSLK